MGVCLVAQGSCAGWAFRSRRPSQTFWDSSFIKVGDKVPSVVVNAVQELSTEKQWKTDITNKENMMEATRKPKVYESSEALQQRYATDGMMSRNSFANICDAQFQYFYEYLGNIPWQVITPLTDRTCAMVVPDIELVSGMMLAAEGFIDACLLARKFITFQPLCRELLPEQDVQLEKQPAVCHSVFVGGIAENGKGKVLKVLHHMYANTNSHLELTFNAEVLTADELCGFTHQET
ncbi:hypothetical protein EK904_000842 [Melospiza melodia maxima]|nr:hypothetical protein EK904_000842 [Melospiza melodia maxima]